MSRAVLALESNLGDQEANLRRALAGLADRLVDADRWLEIAHELEEPRAER